MLSSPNKERSWRSKNSDRGAMMMIDIKKIGDGVSIKVCKNGLEIMSQESLN